MSISKKNFFRGIRLKADNVAFDGKEGELKVDFSSAKFQAYLGGSARNIVTEDQTQTLTNKSINAATNTITNVTVANLASGVIDADLTTVSALDDTIPSAKAAKAYVDSTAGTTAATAQTNLNTHINNTTGAHAASAISNTPAGNLAATTVQGALNELQSDIDTRALQSSLTTEISNRTTADTTLQTNIDNEATARSNADALKVTGPNSSFDNRIARFNGLTGKLIKNSAQAQIDDADNMSGLNSVLAGRVSATDSFAEYEVVDSTTTGTAAVLTPSAPITILTNTSLVSIGTIIAPTGGFAGVSQTIINRTGAAISILDNTGTTAANRVLTGTKASLTLADQASILLKYDYNNFKWNIIGGSGSATASTGSANLDTIFQQNFDSANLGDFTQTGLVLDTIAPLNGAKSAKLTHQAASSQSFKQTVAIPFKFRGQSLTMALAAFSSASIGNVTILFRDETNNVDLQASQQIAATTAVQTFQFGVTIPSNCSSFSYTITALQQSGSPVTYIDDIQLNSYFMGTAVEGQTAYSYSVPKITTQNMGRDLTRDVGAAIYTGALTTSLGDSSILSYNATTGIFTALKKCQVEVSFSARQKTASPITLIINIPYGNGPVEATGGVSEWTSISTTFELSAGSTFNCANLSNTSDLDRTYVTATCFETETKTVTSTDLVPAKAMAGNASFVIPKVIRQTFIAARNAAVASGAVVTGYTPTVTGSGLLSFNSGAGIYTALKACQVIVKFQSIAASTGPTQPVIIYTQSASYQTGASSSQSSAIATALFTMSVGDTITLRNDGNPSQSQTIEIFADSVIDETKTFAVSQQGLVQDVDSSLRLDTYAGYGTTYTKIPRINVLRDQIGDAFTVTDSVTDGMSIRVNKDGIYNFTFGMEGPVSGFSTVALTKNLSVATKGTQNVASLANSDGLLNWSYSLASSGATHVETVTWTGKLTSGDIIRPHTDGGVPGNGTSRNFFSASYAGTLKQLNVNSNQKAVIETSELRFEGASARGTGVNTGIVKFDTQAKIRGDAFTVVNDATLGTVITMKKSGKLDISASLYFTASTVLNITKNLASLTAGNIVGSEAISQEYSSGASDTYSVSASTMVSVGDIIRVYSRDAAPASNPGNSLNLLFQAQEVAVSVTNTLPQFSDSDSCVQVSGANGYGSTSTDTRRFTNVARNIGSDIDYVDSPSLGGLFTAKSAGIYHVSFSEQSNASTATIYVQVRVNGSVVVQGGDSINTANTNDKNAVAALSLYLNAGDVVTAGVGLASQNSGAQSRFIISKVGKPNVTGVNVTPFINIPQPTSQSSYISQTANVVGGANVVGSLTTSSGSGIYSYNSSTGLYTVVKAGSFNLVMSLRANSAASVTASIVVNGLELGKATGGTGGLGTWTSASWTGNLAANDNFRFTNQSNTADQAVVNVSATALADQILTVPETFSTDTASLAYSSTYTLSTLNTAPVGTFITYTYPVNSNARTQTTTAPAQATSDMNANGILLYTRQFNVASTAASPACVAIQIGKGLKGTSLNSYKSAGKTVAGTLDNWIVGAFSFGIRSKEYNESTGVLLLDAGTQEAAITSGALLNFVDQSQQTSAYVTISASKNPSLVGVNVLKPTTVQKFTSGTSQTYTTPDGVKSIRVRMVGGGGGGAGSGNTSIAIASGGAGTPSIFGTFSASGGGGGNNLAQGGPGLGNANTGSAPSVASIIGGCGAYSASVNCTGGQGGSSVFGGAGAGGYTTATAGVANTGGGGGGAGAALSQNGGNGGASGSYVETIIVAPAATYTYTVGAGGTAGPSAGGTNSTAGAPGGTGLIIVEEYY